MPPGRESSEAAILRGLIAHYEAVAAAGRERISNSAATHIDAHPSGAVFVLKAWSAEVIRAAETEARRLRRELRTVKMLGLNHPSGM